MVVGFSRLIHQITHQQPYRHYSAERIACKSPTWSWQLDKVQRRNMTRHLFARYYLMRFGHRGRIATCGTRSQASTLSDW